MERSATLAEATPTASLGTFVAGFAPRLTVLQDPVFGFEVPRALPGVDASICNPRESWVDKEAYDEQQARLAAMFQKNFTKYTGPGVTDYTAFGPKALDGDDGDNDDADVAVR